MESFDFAVLAQEYNSRATGSGLSKAIDIDSNTTHSAPYDAYDTLFSQIQKKVNDRLSDDSLDWEEEEDLSLAIEPLFELVEPQKPLERQETFTEIQQEPMNFTTLENDFYGELSKASVLAEFDERYIVRLLQLRREGGTDIVSLGLDERHLIWQQTCSDNPLLALESISRQLVRPTRPVVESQSSTATIQEVGDDLIELGSGSAAFARFIPNQVPVLNVDSFQ